MNIFVLDEDIKKCARYHCDRHVIKMILESTQIMCTALTKKGLVTPYRPTHLKHPCVLWASKSYSNFIWLKKLTFALNEEYRYRFDKTQDHSSINVIRKITSYTFKDIGLTDFVQVMPEKYRLPDNPVKAYRNFYIGEKLSIANWTKRSVPKWIPTNKLK